MVRVNERLYEWSRSATRIYSKNFIMFFPRTRSPMIFKLGMQHREFELYKVYIYDDPGLTLTYLQRGQIRSPMGLNRENRYSHLMGNMCTKGPY